MRHRNAVRLARKALVRLFEVYLSVSVPLVLSARQNFGGKQPSWQLARLTTASSLGYRRAGYSEVQGFYWHAAVFVTLLVVCSGIVLQLEFSLFKLIDHHLCINVQEPEVTFSPSSAKNELLPSRLIVRAVYLDPRPRNGFINTSVFLVEARKDLLASKAIVACGAGGEISTKLSVRVALNSGWVHGFMPGLTHDVAMIDCFGLPRTPAGSRAFVWYKHKHDKQSEVYRVESEQRYFIPLPKQTHNEDDLKIVVCMSIIRDFPPYMNEFLRYYKHLGVDHIYMTGEDSFIHNGGLHNDAFVRNAVYEGYISFNFWHQWLSDDQVFYHSQMLAHEDCIYRFQGTYDYAFIVDSDDHFIPLLPQRKTLDFYVEQYCKFGSCVFPWLEYYPDCGQVWDRLGNHGNVTNTLVSLRYHRRLRTGKSIHRLTAILDAGTHKPQQLLKGFQFILVPPSVAYVAHLRKNKDPPNGC